MSMSMSMSMCTSHPSPLTFLTGPAWASQGEAREVASVGNKWLAYTPALHTLRESGTTIGT